MAQYIEVEQAIGMPGLRVVLSPGGPGPWSEAAKGILYVKKIPYVKVRQEPAGENVALLNWTKQTTAPAFVYDNERPHDLERPAHSGRAARARTRVNPVEYRGPRADVRLQQ